MEDSSRTFSMHDFAAKQPQTSILSTLILGALAYLQCSALHANMCILEMCVRPPVCDSFQRLVVAAYCHNSDVTGQPIQLGTVSSGMLVQHLYMSALIF